MRRLSEQQKIIEFLGGIDKVAHCLKGWAISATLFDGGFSILTVSIVALCVAIGKEVIYDKWLRKTRADFYDSLATMSGFTIALLFNQLFIYIS